MTGTVDSEPLGDGRTAGWLFIAARPEAPVALVVPALGVAARSYRRFGAALCNAGLHAACLDMRGVGSSPVRARRGVDWGYLDLVDIELNLLYDQVAERLPRAPRVLVGHSLGGQLALLHQARHPQRAVRQVVLLASGSPWSRCYPLGSRSALRGFGAATSAMCRWLGVFRGDLLRFGGPQGATLMRQWAGFVRTGRLGVLQGEWDADAALARLDRPILGLHMRGDHYTPRASTVQLAGMTAGTFRLETIDEPPGHFRWMREPGPVVARLAERLAAGTGG